MTDVKAPLQDAVFDALSAAAEVTGAGPVFAGYVPENQALPYYVIGEITLEPMGGKDGGLDRATVAIVSFSREPSRRPLYAMQDAVREVLDGARLTGTGILVGEMQQDSSEDELLDDGITHQGVQRFSTIVQPA
jgi:hypothetical protein